MKNRFRVAEVEAGGWKPGQGDIFAWNVGGLSARIDAKTQRPVSYDRKCLACHAAGAKPTSNGQGKTCPVAKAKCARCHMPQVAAPGAHQTFTDHEIRIVRANEAYPN